MPSSKLTDGALERMMLTHVNISSYQKGKRFILGRRVMLSTENTETHKGNVAKEVDGRLDIREVRPRCCITRCSEVPGQPLEGCNAE